MWSQYRKYYDCPMCGAKERAVQSQTYPDMIVHKCDGKVLHEVATFKNGVVTPVAGLPKTSKGLTFRTRNFTIKQLESVEEVMDCGQQLSNQARDRSAAEGYFNPPANKLFSISTNGHNQLKYLLLVQGKRVYGDDIRYFSGYGLQQVPEGDGVEILKELVRVGIFSSNPFPDEYPF